MEQRYLKYFCNRIVLEKKKHNISTKDLASKASISKSYLCRIEKGNYCPDESVLLRIYQVMGIALITSVSKLNELNAELDKLHHEMFFCEEEHAHNSYKSIMENSTSFIRSPLYIKYCLAVFNYHNMFTGDCAETTEIKKQVEDLSTQIDFTNEENEWYYDCLGTYNMNLGKYTMVGEALNKALVFGNFPLITSMVYYHMGAFQEKSGFLLKAYKYNELALNAFMEESNYKRLFFTKGHLASIHSQCKEYDEAIKIHQEMLNNPQFDQYKELICRNYVWDLIKTKDYQGALKELLANNAKIIKVPMSYYYVVLCYYRLGKDADALKWIAKGKDVCQSNEIINSRLIAIKMIINKDPKVIDYLEDSLHELESKLNKEEKDFYYEFIIEECKKQRLYKEATEYYEKLLK